MVQRTAHEGYTRFPQNVGILREQGHGRRRSNEDESALTEDGLHQDIRGLATEEGYIWPSRDRPPRLRETEPKTTCLDSQGEASLNVNFLEVEHRLLFGWEAMFHQGLNLHANTHMYIYICIPKYI